jgi:hypothetical protein
MQNNLGWKTGQWKRKVPYSWVCKLDYKDYDNDNNFPLRLTYPVHAGHVASTTLSLSLFAVHLLQINLLCSSFDLCDIFLELVLTSWPWSSSYFQCSSLQRTVQESSMLWNLQGSWNYLTRTLKSNTERGCGDTKTSPTTVDSEPSNNQTAYEQLN